MLFLTYSHPLKWSGGSGFFDSFQLFASFAQLTSRPLTSCEPHSCRRSQSSSQRPHLAARLLPSCKLAATYTRHRPSEADIVRERKLLQLRVIHLCEHFRISQDSKPGRDSCAHGSSRRAWVEQEGRISPCFLLARLRHSHARGEHEGRHVNADRLRGEERPSAPSWTTLSAPARVPLPDALDHARGTLEHDRRDRRGHARARW